jgi:acetyl CoA:N6-hydroxylysine acetyl transferase
MPDSPSTISVRALSLSTDIPVIYNWVSRDQTHPRSWSTRDALRELEAAYTSILESDFAQPFMGLVNGAPVCQLDIYKTRQDAISLYYDDRPGDYGLNWLTAPLCQQEHMLALLKACLEYFFSFPEVGRIITDIESGNEWMHILFKKAGFRYGGDLNIPFKTSHLYIVTRADISLLHS